MDTPNPKPYTRMANEYYLHTINWVETTQETFDYQLGCVPPVRMKANAFMVGEAYTHDLKFRQAVHAAFVEVNGRFFGRLDLLGLFNPDLYTAEIKGQYSI